ncbi:MAG: hypothetical protein A2X56_03930 [Nitrospirae bacterium GWC2_57_13]|nr:MAG: hypothetical protein A2072_00025 [Nitrospirae bacterium GWC1_57_7]OGW27383.1 MAG: hypothetical protein A2X56_03930 [Nitrospirae bacterium GWC2_57_13]OGW43798.1 MAG: hypothetical protein A2X57_00440 [Nitrospirae bacterium GWD2_57_8]HAR45877.1 hypothetical protein [Nitrospiraceae bacterium]
MITANDSVSTERHTTLPYVKWASWLTLSVLFLSAAGASASTLIIARPQSGPQDTTPGIIATGAAYRVVVYRSRMGVSVGLASGKVNLPIISINTIKEHNVKIIDAKVDDPSIVEIIGRDGGVVTLRGKVPGETTLRVKARGKLGTTQTASATVGSAAPNSVRLEPMCDDYRAQARTPLLVATNRELDIIERLYSDKTPLLADSFPEVAFGALIPVPRKSGGETWKSEFLGAYGLNVKTPATTTTTSLKVPAYGYELPVQVYEPSAVSEIRLLTPEKMCQNCAPAEAQVEILVGGEIPCLRPLIPLDVTIGPASICRLQMSILSKGKTDSGNDIYELPFPQSFKIVGSNIGTCSVTVETRGTGKSARKQIQVQRKLP